MNKPLAFVVLAALVLAIAGCAADPPQKTSGTAIAAPSDDVGGDYYNPWTVPIRFF